MRNLGQIRVKALTRAQHTKCATRRNREPHEAESVDVEVWRFQVTTAMGCTEQCVEVVEGKCCLKRSNDIDEVHDSFRHSSVLWESQIVEIWPQVSGMNIIRVFSLISHLQV